MLSSADGVMYSNSVHLGPTWDDDLYIRSMYCRSSNEKKMNVLHANAHF